MSEDAKEVEVTEPVTPSKDELLAMIDGEAVEVKGDVPAAEPENELSDVEQEAVSKGWNPEGIEGKRHKSAEEFMEMQPVYDKVHSQGKKIKKQQESIDAFNDYLTKVDEKAYDRALSDLKTEKTEAMENMDHARVVELDDQIQDHKASKDTKDAQSDAKANSDAFSSFLSDNEWYDDSSDKYDAEKAEKADFLGFQFQKKQQGKPYTEAEFFAAVNKGMVDKPAPKRAAPVKGSGKPPAAKKKGSSHSLSEVTSEMDLKIARTLIRNGDVTEENWLKSYFGE